MGNLMRMIRLLEINDVLCRTLRYGHGKKRVGTVVKVTPKYAWTDTGLKIQRYPNKYGEYTVIGGGDYKKVVIATDEIQSEILKYELRQVKESAVRGYAIWLLSGRISNMSDADLDRHIAFINKEREHGKNKDRMDR